MGRYDYDDYGWKPYVPVAQRRAQAAKEVAKRAKKGLEVSPVRIEGRTHRLDVLGQGVVYESGELQRLRESPAARSDLRA